MGFLFGVNCVVFNGLVLVYDRPAPTCKTSKHTQQTRTGLFILNFKIGTSLLEHLEHKIRPQ